MLKNKLQQQTYYFFEMNDTNMKNLTHMKSNGPSVPVLDCSTDVLGIFHIDCDQCHDGEKYGSSKEHSIASKLAPTLTAGAWVSAIERLVHGDREVQILACNDWSCTSNFFQLQRQIEFFTHKYIMYTYICTYVSVRVGMCVKRVPDKHGWN